MNAFKRRLEYAVSKLVQDSEWKRVIKGMGPMVQAQERALLKEIDTRFLMSVNWIVTDSHGQVIRETRWS